MKSGIEEYEQKSRSFYYVETFISSISGIFYV